MKLNNFKAQQELALCMHFMFVRVCMKKRERKRERERERDRERKGGREGGR